MPSANGMYGSIHEGGPISQPPVILLHGAGTDRMCWPTAIRRLTGQRVIALDLPGHGRSEGVALQSIEAYAESVASFMSGLGIYQAAIVGHSMGAAIALTLALHHPERVTRLALISSGTVLEMPPEILTTLSNPALLKEGIRLMQGVLFGPLADANLQAVVMKKFAEVRSSVLYGDWLAYSRFDFRDHVQKIKKPVWVVCGDHDRLTPPYQARYLAQKIKKADLQIIPKAGHILVLEKPDEICRGLMSFLN